MRTLYGVPQMGVMEMARIANEYEERAAFVHAALSYVGTPYHHMGMVKGVGVDCATLLVCAGIEAGFVLPNTKLEYYSQEWHLHRDEERYLQIISQWCSEIVGVHDLGSVAKPGDIAVWQIGRTFSHGAIVVEWPTIVHAVMGNPVRTERVDRAVWLSKEGFKDRPMKLFSHWPRGEE